MKIRKNQRVSLLRKAGSMAEVLEDHVESIMPDLTQASLQALLDAPMPDAHEVLDRSLEHPAQDRQEQAS
jgi:hypothetical protein